MRNVLEKLFSTYYKSMNDEGFNLPFFWYTWIRKEIFKLNVAFNDDFCLSSFTGTRFTFISGKIKKGKKMFLVQDFSIGEKKYISKKNFGQNKFFFF